MKKTIIALIFLIVLGGAYFVSPYFAIRNFAVAFNTNQEQALQQYVNFPAVRASLKKQMHQKINQEILAQKNNNANNAEILLGLALASTVANNLVDSLVTPQAISQIIQTGTAPNINPTAPQLTKTNFKEAKAALLNLINGKNSQKNSQNFNLTTNKINNGNNNSTHSVTNATPNSPNATPHTKSAKKTSPASKFTKDMIKSMGFTNINEFTIVVQHNPKQNPLTLIFKLQGTSWLLTDIQLKPLP